MPLDPFIGEIFMFAGTFAPREFAFCDGQLLPIAQNTALFSLLGTTYGGDGRTTFALPDLRGRTPVHAGQGPGLTIHPLGERFGVETVTLTTTQMPAHSHSVLCQTAGGNQTGPGGGFPAADQTGNAVPYSGASNATMNPAMLSTVGNSQSHENRPPSLAVNFIIALTGIFPSRP